MTTLLVDLDGTIMANPFHSAVFPIICAELAAKTGRPPNHILALILQENQNRLRTGVPARLAMDWDDITQTVARRLGTWVDRSPEDLVRAHCTSPYIAILDEADRWLPRVLDTPGRRLFAATQGLARYQVPVLQALGLWPLFSGILAPDTTGHGKGEEGFYAPVRRSGDLLLSVGDRYDDDVVAPARCGILPIWKVEQDLRNGNDPITRARTIPLPPGETIRPAAVIGHLRELPEVVRTLEQG